MKYHVGCSGYSYREWKGNFYPQDLPSSRWLQFYAEHFSTIEINASFYRFPTVKGLKTWYDKTPSDFTFTLKAHKTITHEKRFQDVSEQMNALYEIAKQGLKDKLRCILFQMPPSFKYEPEQLEKILNHINPEFRNVLEFRHSSWWNKEVFDALQERKAVFCSSSFPALPDELVKTSGTGYVRFHGKPELYKSGYSQAELKRWAKLIKDSRFKECYIYFNNTWLMAAIENAYELVKFLGQKG
jgi:uncharacterized protein YecE (DUF72 family)